MCADGSITHVSHSLGLVFSVGQHQQAVGLHNAAHAQGGPGPTAGEADHMGVGGQRVAGAVAADVSVQAQIGRAHV